ncbi:GNAT family N-acetyltransferase [Ruminococcus sp.]|uniref:GNAT family N-acetyltransferase n=1 Tax=Ruminococcus sp. TaxID=41978 RepID=UPI00386BA293
MKFKHYSNEDYEAVCGFLIELNRENQNHINWNWARFEWMMEHPEFDKSLTESIGLWMDGEEVVGAAIYDMYFGEAFCGVLPEYETLYPEILDYAYRELRNENGLGIAICDDCADKINMAESAGFAPAEQTETVMRIDLIKELHADLPDGLQYAELDPVKEPYAFQWLLWQGFDHGTDKAEFEREGDIISEIPEFRKHFDPALSVAAKNSDGEYVSYCCLWYSDKTDYAYVEPVCTVSSYRGKGVAKAVIYEALNRARSLGAKKAYVLSDMSFYDRLGFIKDKQFTFYWKRGN